MCKLSWEYDSIFTEEFDGANIEIFEYQSKIFVRVINGDGDYLDLISTEDEENGWRFLIILLIPILNFTREYNV